MLCNYIEEKWMPFAEKKIGEQENFLRGEIAKLGPDPKAQDPASFLRDLTNTFVQSWVSTSAKENSALYATLVNTVSQSIQQAQLGTCKISLFQINSPQVRGDTKYVTWYKVKQAITSSSYSALDNCIVQLLKSAMENMSQDNGRMKLKRFPNFHNAMQVVIKTICDQQLRTAKDRVRSLLETLFVIALTDRNTNIATTPQSITYGAGEIVMSVLTEVHGACCVTITVYRRYLCH